ncbi:MAG TPA: trypsin-like peptidase domain-containing protein [Baekduia sp.]|nr:trypsin-like peptidase domain-containing protein [Baekduia sp.]
MNPKAVVPYLAAGLLGGAVAGGAVVIADDGAGTKTVIQQAPLVKASGASDSRGLTAADIYKRYAAGVAYITAEVKQPTASPFDLDPERQQGTASGSGFVVDKDGDVLTNAHVVEGATAITVQLGNQKKLKAKLVGVDRATDLALLKVDVGKDDLTVLPLGSSTGLTVGDPTIAIGNPFGLERTLTTGVISALQRRLEAPDQNFAISDVIQTDAAINPGNSGGPLIDATGRVIGINSQIATASGSASSGNVGIGFAVPIDTAKRIIPQLKESGSVQRAYLGVTAITIDEDVSSLNLPVDYGALVQAVEPNSPASKVGLKPGTTRGQINGEAVVLGGDIILTVDGAKVTTNDNLQELISSHKPGDTVSLKIRQGKAEKTISVKLAKRPVTG